MKVNEAPEKLYFSATENGTHYYTEGIPFEREYIEYTRTDAFIEKVCAFLKDRIEHDSIDYPMATMHLINDLKRYVKENKL